MTDNVKSYKVEVDGADKKFLVICSEQGHLKDLMQQLKTCANCTVTDVNRDAIKDMKSMQTIYEKMS